MRPEALALVALLAGCESTGSEELPDPVSEIVNNQGGDMEGSTSMDESGLQGTGIVVGDEAYGNPSQGVQSYLSFNIKQLVKGTVTEAVLKAVGEAANVGGTPFADLGPMMVQEVRYSQFSGALYNLEKERPDGGCQFADAADGPFRCDIIDIVQRALDDDRKWAQVRLRHRDETDGDGVQDSTQFRFGEDVNLNESGLFQIKITVQPPAEGSEPEETDTEPKDTF